jgi:hypothetical protein
MSRKSWIQINGQLIPKEQYRGEVTSTVQIIGDIEPFVSPITQEVIRGRGHLRRHMQEHGVTHADDYSPEFLHRKRQERLRQQERQGKAQRIELLKHALER